MIKLKCWFAYWLLKYYNSLSATHSLYAWSFARRTWPCPSCESGIWGPPALQGLSRIRNEKLVQKYSFHFSWLSLHVLSALVRQRSLQLLTSKLDPPQDEEDENGDEDYGDARANHHPHHLKRRTKEKESWCVDRVTCCLMTNVQRENCYLLRCFNLLLLHYFTYMIVFSKY